MANGGEKSIESIVVGDRVRSHTGKSRNVTHVMSRSFTGKMVTMNLKGFPFPLTATDDHKIAVWRDGYVRGHTDRREDGYLEWIEAHEVRIGDLMILSGATDPVEDEWLDFSEAIPEPAYTRDDKKECRFSEAGISHLDRVGLKQSRYRNHIFRRIPITASLGRLVGLYLAEGGCHEGRLTFTFHRKELHLAEEVVALIRGIFGVESRIELPESRPSVCQVRCQNLNVCAAFKWMVPGNVYSKRVPAFIMRAPEKIRSACLRGWLDGDGHVTKKGWFAIVGVSVCKEMIRDMLDIAVSIGLTAKINIKPANKRSRQSYQIHMTGKMTAEFMGIHPAVKVRDLQGTRCKYGKVARVTSVSAKDVVGLQVYDFTVEGDHSFVANNIVVHNCINGGGQNAGIGRIACDSLFLGQIEKFFIPWTLTAYGYARYLLGDTNPGEGANNAYFSKALSEVGVGDALNDPGLPKPNIRPCGPASQVIVYTKQVELTYSAWRNSPESIVANCRKHPVVLIRCKSADEVELHLRRGRHITVAGNWGGAMQARVDGSGDDRVLLQPMQMVDEWSHQQSCDGLWRRKGQRLFRIQNQWYFTDGNGAVQPVHGPAQIPGEPEGGSWYGEAMMDHQCRNGDVYALKGITGIPESMLDFSKI
jgi:hypothetical protein